MTPGWTFSFAAAALDDLTLIEAHRHSLPSRGGA